MRLWDADTKKQNGSWVYLPMWQGNNVFRLCYFFFFNLAPPGYSMNFWFLSHTEKFWGAVTCLQRICGVVKKARLWKHFYFCCDQIPSQPSVLCLAQTVALSSYTVSINDRYLRNTSISDLRSAVYRLLYLTFPASFLLAIIKTRLLTDFQQDNNHHSVSLSCYRSVNSC